MKRRRVPKTPLTEIDILRRENKMLKKIIKEKLHYIGYLLGFVERETTVLRTEIDKIPKEAINEP